jgi:hypothetical protein
MLIANGRVAETATPTASKAFAEVFDGAAPEFQRGSECLRLSDVIAEQFEETAQTGVTFYERGKAGFRRVELGEGFFFEEGGVGVVAGIRDEIDGADEVIVLKLDPGEVFGRAKNEVLLAVMEPGDVFEDEAFKFVEGVIEIEHRIFVMEKLEDGLGGEAVGVVAFGQDALDSTTPGKPSDLVIGKEKSLLEEELPSLLRQQCPPVGACVRHAWERA